MLLVKCCWVVIQVEKALGPPTPPPEPLASVAPRISCCCNQLRCKLTVNVPESSVTERLRGRRCRCCKLDCVDPLLPLLVMWPLNDGVMAVTTQRERIRDDAFAAQPRLRKRWWMSSYRGGVAASHNGGSDWPVLQPEERRQDLIPASESCDYGSTSRLFSVIRDICTQVCDGTHKTWRKHMSEHV